MASPKKNRQAKMKRRRSYEAAIHRKFDIMDKQWFRLLNDLYGQLGDTEEKLKEQTARSDRIQAATEALLKSRLVVDVADARLNPERRVTARYDHPDRVHPLTCFKSLAVMLAESDPPCYEPPHTVRIESFTVNAFDTISMLERTEGGLMREIERATDHIGFMIGRLILKNMMEQAVRAANKKDFTHA